MIDHPFVKREKSPLCLAVAFFITFLVSTFTSNYMVIPMGACPYYEEFIKQLMGIMPWVVSCWLDVY